VIDAKGQTRSGNVTAPGLEEARQMVLAKGLKLVELGEEKESPGKLSLRKASGKSRPVAPAGMQYRPGFWDRVAMLKPDSPVYLGLITATATIGVLLWIAEYRKSASPLPQSAVVKDVHFQVLGTVSLAGIKDFGDVWVAVQFPQVPFQKDFRWSDLPHASRGRFQAEVEIRFPNRPTRFRVRVVKPGFQDAVSREILIPDAGVQAVAGDLELRPLAHREGN